MSSGRSLPLRADSSSLSAIRLGRLVSRKRLQESGSVGVWHIQKGILEGDELNFGG